MTYLTALNAAYLTTGNIQHTHTHNQLKLGSDSQLQF